MPFSGDRFNRLVEVKDIKQQDLADRAEIAQSQVSDCRKGVCRTNELTEKLAKALDCTPDFLLCWSYPGVDDDAGQFRAAVSQMSFDVFVSREKTTTKQKERCRKVLSHGSAPVTADGWVILAEQIDLAFGDPPAAPLFVVKRGSR